jgi:hypothetical protein
MIRRVRLKRGALPERQEPGAAGSVPLKSTLQNITAARRRCDAAAKFKKLAT